MSVSTTTNRFSSAGNGVTTAFSYSSKFLANADLKVVLRVDATGVETTKTLTTHYTVSGAGADAGGTVTMLTAPATGETLIIYGDPALTQGLDLVENDSLPAESAEEAYDRLTLIAQRLDSRLDRAVVMTDGYSATFDPTLPAVLTASYLFGVNAGATGFELVSLVAIGAISLPAGTGLAVYTGSSAFTVRTLTAGKSVTVTQGTGVSGDPTVAVAVEDSELVLAGQIFFG